MGVVSKKMLLDFARHYADSRRALLAWHTIAEAAHWNSFADVRQTYATASLVGKWIVFNIRGNHYRVITEINFERKTIFIRHVLIHAEYDRGALKR